MHTEEWTGAPFHPLHEEHVVQLYQREEELLSTVRAYTWSALRFDEAVLLAATRAHVQRFKDSFASSGMNVKAEVGRGALTFLTAEDVLPQLLRDGTPDPGVFRALITESLDRSSAGDRFRHVHVFGELVDVLWKEGRKEEAIQLEALWNGLQAERPFTLFCGYQSQHLDEDPAAKQGILDAHTSLVRKATTVDGVPQREMVKLTRRPVGATRPG